VKLAIINPRNGVRSEIELQLSEAVMTAAKHDLAVSKFVAEMARQHLPDGYMLIGTDFRTP
jgi:hypothetical protein